MTTNLKPPTPKARALLKKLQALADRGIDGEKAAAKRKIARLKARFDFTAPDLSETPDLFEGKFNRSSTARPIYTFTANELDVASSVKWAIEAATQVRCGHRGAALLAETTPASARRLRGIACHIASSFRILLEKFSTVEGVSTDDRGVFLMGLYDGMMNETREAGLPLPGRPGLAKWRKRRKPAASGAASLHIHPYTLALGLGRQIRFSAPVEQLAAELDVATRKCLAQEHDTERHK